MIKPKYYIYTCLETLLIITDQHNMLIMFQLVEWILNDNVLSVEFLVHPNVFFSLTQVFAHYSGKCFVQTLRLFPPDQPDEMWSSLQQQQPILSTHYTRRSKNITSLEFVWKQNALTAPAV